MKRNYNILSVINNNLKVINNNTTAVKNLKIGIVILGFMSPMLFIEASIRQLPTPSEKSTENDIENVYSNEYIRNELNNELLGIENCITIITSPNFSRNFDEFTTTLGWVLKPLALKDNIKLTVDEYLTMLPKIKNIHNLLQERLKSSFHQAPLLRGIPHIGTYTATSEEADLLSNIVTTLCTIADNIEYDELRKALDISNLRRFAKQDL